MISVTIRGEDVTSRIKMGSLSKNDQLNQKVDTLSFSIESYEGNEFIPELDDEVIMEVDSVLQFGGSVMKISHGAESQKVITYDIDCSDYAKEGDRMLIQEQFEEETVDDIIDFIVTNYAPTFTFNNVNCPIVIKTITFDRIPLSQALDKLSKLTNYSYYIDYEKDIHFFAKNDEAAPFNLTDNSNNYIIDSLSLSYDLSQIRNQVFVRGGEIEGTERTEVFSGDGEKVTFVLGNKFARVPTVTVGGSPVTVGVDFIDQEADFDAFWNFEQKYVRFKDTEIPGSGTNNIEVTGIPLFTLVMRVANDASIAKYGVWEFSAEDKTIKSREEAKTFGIAQLQAYAESVVEGSFKTYTPGLRSGQLITITSDFRGTDEQFLIQKVKFQMINPDNYVYTVTLATFRTVGIIDFLIGLLLTGKAAASSGTVETLEKVIFETEEVVFSEDVVTSKVHNPMSETVTFSDSVDTNIDYDPEFVLGPYVPTGHKRVFILDGSRLG